MAIKYINEIQKGDTIRYRAVQLETIQKGTNPMTPLESEVLDIRTKEVKPYGTHYQLQTCTGWLEWFSGHETLEVVEPKERDMSQLGVWCGTPEMFKGKSIS